jgi:hypothetical protein
MVPDTRVTTKGFSMSTPECGSTIYDPAVNATFTAQDMRDQFKLLASKTVTSEKDKQHFVSRKTLKRVTAALASGNRGTGSANNDGTSRSIGFWPIDGKLLFERSTSIRYVIIFPEVVEQDFTSHLYLTSSNRSAKGTESHIAFAGDDSPAFFIYDWSVLGDSKQQLVRNVPISQMEKYVFPASDPSFRLRGILVINQTRLVENTTWINCVHLGVFENGRLDHFDTVYSNTYALASNADQQPSYLTGGFWGPEVECFQNFAQQINTVGFSGCWLVQDGNAILLDGSNTVLHDDNFGLKLYFQTPWRDFLVH